MICLCDSISTTILQHLQSKQPPNRRQQYTCRALEAHRALPLALGIVSSRTVAPIRPSAATTCIKVALCDVLGRTPRGLEQPSDVRPGCLHATCSQPVFELNCCKTNPAIPGSSKSLSTTTNARLRHCRISQRLTPRAIYNHTCATLLLSLWGICGQRTARLQRYFFLSLA
jgi:hypothetical protein